MVHNNYSLPAVITGFAIGVFITTLLKSDFYPSTKTYLSEPQEAISHPVRVGILIVATGKYTAFAKRLVNSCRQFLLTEPSWMKQHYQVTYFIFTDRSEEVAQGRDVQFIYQRPQGWPWAALWRCQVYLNATEKLLKVDYVISLDAEMIIADTVGPEVLGDLVATIHPHFYNQMPETFTFERNPASKAYIPYDKGNRYYAAGVFGGKTKQVLEMCRVMDQGMREDFHNNILAIWHDESHLNHYFIMAKPPTLLLGPSYCWPEEYWIPPFRRIILAGFKNDSAYHIFVPRSSGTT